MEDQELYLNEIFSLCVRRGKTLLITALVFAVLLGGFKAYRQNAMLNATDEEKRYQADLLKYRKKVQELEHTIGDGEKVVEEKREYLDNSLLMKLNPYKYYATSIYFGFTNIDDTAWDRVHYSATSLDFVYSMLRGQYLVCWNSMELPKDLDISGYEGVQDQYMREVLTLTAQDGGMLCITACGNSAEESETLADALYAALLKQQPTVTKSTFKHSVSMMNRTTRTKIDAALDATQRDNQNALAEAQLSADEAMAELRELKEPVELSSVSVVKDALIFAALGAIIGGIAACIGVFLWGLMANVLISSHQAERWFALTPLGAVKQKRSVFDAWSDKLTGERRWKDREKAVLYVAKELQATAAPSAKLLLASTAHENKSAASAEALQKALNEQGFQARCAYDALHDPSFIDGLKESDGVVLLERQGETKLTDMDDTLKLVKEMEKPVLGLVLA